MTQYLYFIPALVVVLTFHEFAHAWTANYLGDSTAKYNGRVSLNPLRHLDLMGTLMLFLVGLGWGKPVPVDPRNFEHPVRDSAITAAAGPLANLAIAFVAAFPYKYLVGTFAGTLFGAVFQLSIVLFIFNLLPFPPLDGSKVLGFFIPTRYQRNYQEFLYHGTKYFMIFVLADLFLVKEILGYSLLWYAISYLYMVVSTGIMMVT
ncbi:MAG: site-2 protease family protein [Patescibacteria group bacterium]